jgi:hypothetical protein
MLGCMFMAYFQESDVCQAMCPIGNGQAYYTYFMRYNISLAIPQARPPVRGFELGPFAPLPRTEPLRYQALVKNDKFQNKKLKMKMKIKIKINFPF